MADFTFHIPNRTADPTGTTIGRFEAYPSSRRVHKMQSRRVTAGGNSETELFGSAIQYLTLNVKALSNANRITLYDILTNAAKCNWAGASIDITDQLGRQYNSAVLWQDDIDFLLISSNTSAQYDEVLEWRCDPA